jgi:hypothetical protein
VAKSFVFEEMERAQSKLSVAVYAPSGAGKTTAALKIAMGIRDQLYPGEDLKQIGLFIDTERRSSTKAVGRRVGGETLEPMELYAFEPPYDVTVLADLLNFAAGRGKKIVVIDSYTAFWSGCQGILEEVADLEVQLGESKKAYGAWSERTIINKKNILKNLMSNSQLHLIVCFRAKTEYVMEMNYKGKMQPKAVGLKEDTQTDVRYEFDAVLSIDKETHGIDIVKDRIGFEEYRITSDNPEAPITVEDGRVLARIVSEGLTLAELAERKRARSINFILDEKRHKSSKLAQFEQAKGIEITREYLEALPEDNLKALTKFLN